MGMNVEPAVLAQHAFCRVAGKLPAHFRARFPDICSGDGVPGLVSVVIPAYNRSNLLRKALASVAAQTWRNIEVIVVDDGSQEDLRPVVAEFEPIARLVRQANAGVTAARNRGLSEVRGEFIAFLDSDDTWDACKIALEVAILRRHPDVIMAWTDMRAVDETETVLADRYLRKFYNYDRIDGPQTLAMSGTASAYLEGCPEKIKSAVIRIGDIFPPMLHGNVVHTSTVLFRRSRLVTLGGFDPQLERAGEDYEFHWRTSYLGPVALIEAPLVSYRVGAADQLTSEAWGYLRARNALTTVNNWVMAAGPELKLQPNDVRERVAELQMWCGERLLMAGGSGAVQHIAASLRLKPMTMRAWLLLALAAIPAGHRARILDFWHRRPRRKDVGGC